MYYYDEELECEICGAKISFDVLPGDIDRAHEYEGMILCFTCYEDEVYKDIKELKFTGKKDWDDLTI